ncbi:aminotransferase class I/II-fold pyridoxal phosphate-dependent enzyme [Streptomyces sp. ZAF1911]|uniref:aminotransferase class I/II-fold pyridoxal phosphate-dependent enzyme n=1 Tax=Streptomyces sp. ZAF1911 TaxID=2944129 RepID=UPI00237B2BFF|nr:aminotransferase class I/II-fold pyridoxal phosphate-dependent enzyme [Streptomyces sp. ZAF1911]MDD9375745.1 aminotransferase class I/II-fold pyridoxal phosphate-dependent enzyme [Streptomyces sp. ZAF1911]
MLSTRARTLPASSTAALDAHIKSLMADGADVINLTGGELDFPTPDQASDGGRQAISRGLTRYTPVAGIGPLREAIARRLETHWGCSYTAAQIVTTNGAKQALAQLFTVLCDPGDEVILQAPYWVSFPHMIRLAGATPVVVDTVDTGFKLTPGLLRAHITPSTRVVLLNNPSNPTGVVYDRAELLALAGVAVEHDLVIVSDEIYGDLVHEGASFTSVASLGPDIAERTVTVGGFSKTYAMTGWRIGFAAAPLPVAAALTAVQGHTSSAPSSISQYAALAALTGDTDIELARRAAELNTRRTLMRDGLAALPPLRLAAEPQGGFFALVDVRGLYRHPDDDAGTVTKDLLEHAGVAVMPGRDFGAPDLVRLSYAVGAEDISQALHRISTHLKTINDRRTPMSSNATAFEVHGMTCGGCAKRIRTAIVTDLGEGTEVTVDHKAGRVTVSSTGEFGSDAVQAAVERAGYKFVGTAA